MFIKDKGGKIKLIACENFGLFVLLVPEYQFLNCYVNRFLENLEKKKFTLRV